MNKFYLCTAIAYVNGVPHIGHALEFIQADALARYYRLNGVDTRFLTGTDENGVKIYEKAQEEGMDTQEFVDKNAAVFRSLKEKMNLSNDDFIRTTSGRHIRGAQKIWRKMVEKGDIYKDVYEGNYCVGCESFIPEKDLDENGNCPIHKKPLQQLKEENYFFRLSRYSDKIRTLIETDEVKIIPESRKKEMLNIIGEKGLHDVSFSRPKAVLPWGVDVPDDPDQVMYVWCDALSNYITALDYENEGESFLKYWPCDAQIIGKDILRFHGGIWVGMLLSAGILPPRAIYTHGFITSEGQKMSKSLGNVVDPLEVIEEFGLDPVRYYLLREIPTTDDGDFSRDRFVTVYNSELANSLGNLVNRVLMMVERYLDGVVPENSNSSEISDDLTEIVDRYRQNFENFDLKAACEEVVELVNFANKYIDDMKPWAMAKEADQKLPVVLYNLLEMIRFIGLMLLPVIPDSAEKILAMLGGENRELNFGGLVVGSKITAGEQLFPRIEIQ